MNKLTVSASPHITKKGSSTRNIMLDVIIALIPAVLAATFFFGYHVIINVFFCVVFCAKTELLFGLILRKKFDREGIKKSSMWDLSAVVTGIILALNLPAKVKVDKWDFNIYSSKIARTIDTMVLSGDTILICLIGSVFAIALVKMLFGGIGKNFANPAATARIFLFLAFTLGVSQTAGIGFKATTGATWLVSNAKFDFVEFFVGNKGAAAVGETSIAAILIGFIYLSIRKVIDFRIPLILILSAAVFTLLFNLKMLNKPDKAVEYILASVLSGGLVFGAVFMATDYSSSPNTFIGQVVFAVGIGLFTVMIREFASWPEGMSFAIVLMNVAAPLIDKYIVPKPFGYVKEIKDKTVKEPQKAKVDKNTEVSV